MDNHTDLPVALLNEFQAAAVLHVSVPTLRRWRRTGDGPVYTKLGKSAKALVRYRPEDVEAFVARGLRCSISQRPAMVAGGKSVGA